MLPAVIKNIARLSHYAVEQLNELIEMNQFPLSWYQQLRLDGRLGRLKGEIDPSQIEPESSFADPDQDLSKEEREAKERKHQAFMSKVRISNEVRIKSE